MSKIARIVLVDRSMEICLDYFQNRGVFKSPKAIEIAIHYMMWLMKYLDDGWQMVLVTPDGGEVVKWKTSSFRIKGITRSVPIKAEPNDLAYLDLMSKRDELDQHTVTKFSVCSFYWCWQYIAPSHQVGLTRKDEHLQINDGKDRAFRFSA